jgi:hypothetical protein
MPTSALSLGVLVRCYFLPRFPPGHAVALILFDVLSCHSVLYLHPME